MRRTDRRKKWIAAGLAASLLAGCLSSAATAAEYSTEALQTELSASAQTVSGTESPGDTRDLNTASDSSIEPVPEDAGNTENAIDAENASETVSTADAETADTKAQDTERTPVTEGTEATEPVPVTESSEAPATEYVPETGSSDASGKELVTETDCTEASITEQTPETELPSLADTEHIPETEASEAAETPPSTENETGTEQMPATESAGEPAEPEETPEAQTEQSDENILVLEGQCQNVTVRASRSDHEPFPKGACVTITTLEELAQEAEDPAAELAQYQEILTNAAVEALSDEYMALHPETEWNTALTDALQASLLEAAGALHAYDISVWHGDGSCFDASRLDLLLQISDGEMKHRIADGSAAVRVVDYTDASGAVLPGSEKCTTGISQTEEMAYFSISDTEQGILAALELDGSWSFDAEQEIADEDAESLADGETSLYAVPENSYKQIGTNMAASGSFTPVSYGDRFYSNNYTSLCKTGASAISAWNNGGKNVKVFELVNSGGNSYTAMVPLNGNAQGAFGWRISNVGFSRAYSCQLDAVITVEAYSTDTATCEGKKVENVYPVIAISPGGNVVYNQSLPSFRLRYDIVQSGTSTPVPGNYRFCWLDIDAGQQYGFAVANGTIDGKYCTASTVVNTDTHKYSDGLVYTRMIAPVKANGTRNPNYQAYFEVGNTSCFKLWVGPAYRDNDGKTGYTKDHIEGVYSNVINKNWDYASKSIIEWDGTSPGPVSGEPVEKFVSNDGVTWQKENTLRNTDAEFWYMLRTRVPEMYGYTIASYTLNDVLPAGVDYVGEFSAMQMETGADATSFFLATFASEDNISFSWNDTPGFGRYTYQLRFKVRMDPSEMTPSYAGDTRTYTVSNSASLLYQIKGYDTLTYQSDSVTTTAQEKRTEPQSPTKSIRDGSSYVTEKEYNNRLFETVFSVEQAIPAYTESWRFSSFSLSDTLEECFALQSAALYLEGDQAALFPAVTDGAQSGGWTLSVNGQTVTVTAASGLADVYYGKTLRLELNVKLKAGNSTALENYYAVNGGTIKAVIPNQATVSCAWPDGASCTKETNVVTVLVKEAMAVLTVSKTNNVTGDSIANAVFTVYQWNGSAWSSFCGMTYDTGANCYRADRYLYKTIENGGRFLVQEDVTPAGYLGAWSEEFTLTGAAGELIPLDFHAGNEPAAGKITVKKTSQSGAVLAGAVYAVTARADIVSPEGRVLISSGTEAARVTTGEDGLATADGLYPGSYRITEVQPPSGYCLNRTPQDVTIRYLDKEQGCSSEEVTFVNEATIVFLKKVSALAEGETEKRPLSGVSFCVWEKQSGTEGQALEYTTDSDGLICLEGYLPGTYCYQELSAPAGYLTDETVHEFEIDSAGTCAGEQNHIIEVENQYISAEFCKADKATGKLLAGAKLSLFAADGTVVDTWITDDKPHRIDRLPAGSYTLTELEAPEGYKKGDDMICDVTAEAGTQTFTIADVKYVNLRLTKAIEGDEIVWAHGNPTFTFCVEGTDLDGEEHTYYETVEFTQETASGSGRKTLTAVFRVPAGSYNASETNVIRYRLDAIEHISNGEAAGLGVHFDLSGNQDGEATFVNRKETDHGLTDTAFVRNTVINFSDSL